MKNKKTKIAIISVIALILVTIAVTYAYWTYTRSQTNPNAVGAACLDIEITNEGSAISLANQFPITDEVGLESSPYTFTVKNNCNTSIDYQISLEALGTESTSLKTSSMKVALNDAVSLLSDNVEVDTTIEGAYESRKLLIETLDAKGTAAYELRLWIDADAPVSENNKTFTSKISVTVGEEIKNDIFENPYEEGTLASLMLEHAETNNYLYTTTPNFNTVPADGEYGIYSAEDDYGISYYFRGDAENNYVKFGTWKETISDGVVGCKAVGNNSSCVGSTFETMEACEASADGYAWCKDLRYGETGNDMYWRIIRINGDGTIRLLYEGINAYENDATHAGIIGKTAYNTNTDASKYAGYTYDDGTGVQVNSTIKTFVDKWYTTNLESDCGKYIADGIFCNDRTFRTENGHEIYSAYERGSAPVLKCTNQSDRYTVQDTINGNGLLTNPVGLITADEVRLAGKYFLRSSETYWTLSPLRFTGTLFLYSVQTGNLYIGSGVNNVNFGARPVINLKSDVEFTGDGTIDNPYKIVTE